MVTKIVRVLFLESSQIWLNTLPYGFRDAGHKVKSSGPLTKENILKIIKNFHPDFVISIGMGPETNPNKQSLIRHYVKPFGIPIIYWAVEDPHFTHSFTMPLIHRMKPDFVFTLSKEKVNFYKQKGIPSAHLDFGFHPSVHSFVETEEHYRSSIAIVANAYPNVLNSSPDHYRNQSLKTLIQPLVSKEILFYVWGRDWEKMKPFLGKEIPKSWIKGYINYPEANKVYSSADIMIGLQNYKTQVTQRTYEILGSKGFLITSDTDAVRELFKPGQDLIVSSSSEETINLVEYYLQYPDKRKRIQEQGRCSVQKHSYKYRAEQIIRTLKIEKII
ncbi:MAG: CgeB family protein [Bacillota bacterium]